MIDFEKADKDDSLVEYEGETYKLAQLRDGNNTVLLFGKDGSHKILTTDEQKEAVKLVRKNETLNKLLRIASEKLDEALLDIADVIVEGSSETVIQKEGAEHFEIKDDKLPQPIDDPTVFLQQDYVYVLHFPRDISEEPHILALKTKFEHNENTSKQELVDEVAGMMTKHVNLIKYRRAYRTEQEAVKALALIVGKTGEIGYERVNINKDK